MNVEHGFAAYAQGSDKSVFLFDCGYSSSYRPSEYLPARGINRIRRLFITNYDEDHIGDLPAVRKKMSIEFLSRNPTLSSAQLRSLKRPVITSAMNELLVMIDTYTAPVAPEQLDPPGLRAWTFYNKYPDFTDTNNLSPHTFLYVGDVLFVLPGDLERPGWLKLLENPRVRELLGRVCIRCVSSRKRERVLQGGL